MTNQWNVTLDENGTLSSQQAFELYEQGVEVWNAFMDEYPETFVDFSEFDFTRHQESDEISFSSFQFPTGACFDEARFGGGAITFEDTKFGASVSFERTKFGASVSFERTKFGNGEVSFESAKFSYGVLFLDAEFGDGDVSFSNTKFGNGGVSFDGAVFGEGNVSFNKTNFGDGNVLFNSANFGNGNISFERAKFDSDLVSFIDVEFGDGETSFSHAEFNNSNVKFGSAIFGTGNKSFACTTFGKGHISFLVTEFGNGDISFEQARLGDEEVTFSNVEFGSGTINFNSIKSESLDFSDSSFSKSTQSNSTITFSMERAQISKSLLLPNLDFTSFNSVSFRGTSIGTLFDIEGSQFGQLPDLTATTINGHVSVDRIHVGRLEERKNMSPTTGKARRLKELAKKSEDRKTQLDMLALELESMKAPKQISYQSRWLNIGYKWFSNYGRSIARPFLWLIFFCVLFTGFHISFSEKENTCQDALLLSISQSLPFLSSSRTITQTSLTALYGVEEAEAETKNEAPRAPLNNNLVKWTGLIQNLLSYILLFFIGLGIRNRFKL